MGRRRQPDGIPAAAPPRLLWPPPDSTTAVDSGTTAETQPGEGDGKHPRVEQVGAARVALVRRRRADERGGWGGGWVDGWVGGRRHGREAGRGCKCEGVAPLTFGRGEGRGGGVVGTPDRLSFCVYVCLAAVDSYRRVGLAYRRRRHRPAFFVFSFSSIPRVRNAVYSVRSRD